LASLIEHTGTLDRRLTKHLLRRACFQYSKDQLEAMTGKTPAEILTQLATAKTFSLEWPYDPITNGSNSNCPGNLDGNWINSSSWTNAAYPCGQGRKRGLVAGWWWYNAIKQNSLIDKLTWFLFTTFTASKDDGSGKAAHFFDYLNLLQFHADKSVKDLARKITFDNSMLYYLDNGDNNNNSPNENYAREFLELFTIGKGPQIADGDYTHYTEHDVVQAAKVFSGVKFKVNRDVFDAETVKAPHYPLGIPMGYINTSKHDTSDKVFSHAFINQTIMGGGSEQEINTELDDFVDMVFNQLETAKNYVRKLYRMYVRSEWGQDVEDDIITPLAQQLQSNGFNIKEVLITLLKSQHFYDLDDSDSSNENIGGIIKNPLQYLNELICLLNVQIPNAMATPPVEGESLTNDNEYYNFYRFWWFFCHNTFFSFSGMSLFAPPSVAGYSADYQSPAYDRAWFNSNNIVARYNTILSFIGSTYNDSYGNGNNRIQGVQTTPSGAQYFSRIWTNFSTVQFIENTISDASNAELIIQELADLFYCESIDNDRIAYFKLFLIPLGQPDYYWSNAWNSYTSTGDYSQVKIRLDELIPKMINAAEFQLM
jgi:uncharacterized protein (DUF1800 family)